MRGLQLADHRLFITVCHRHLPTANREMNHRLSRQTRHQRPVAGRSRDPRSPAYAYLTRRLPRGTARGTAFRIVPAHRELPVLRAVSSVLLVRTVNGAVLMVRRRSTVRFRNGAPGHEKFSNDSNERRGTSRKRRSSAPMAAKAPMAQPEPGRQLLKVAVGGPSWDSLVTARTRSPRAGRPAA